MLTVPACEECNQSFKKGDEYTAMVIALDVQAASHRDVIGNMATITRSFQYPHGRRFVNYLMSQTTPSPILTPSGVPVRKLTRDVERLASTGKRLIRGLHYVEMGKPLAPEARITMSMSDSVEPSDDLIKLAVQAYDASKERRQRDMGNTFGYAAGFDDDGRSTWVIMVYGFFFWFATVGEPYDMEAIQAA